MSDHFRSKLKAAQSGDRQALAQALTEVERLGPGVLVEPLLQKPPGLAYRVGITGPPGAGKSTLVGQLLPRLRQAGLKIGVLAVDPSSPFSQGAILGDRLRYGEFVGDPGMFVRSLGTRGAHGGLSASAYLMLRVFDACGFDLVLIETVGVGQTELDIMAVADDIAVVLVPESGDSIQAMKAGLMEIANVFIVNKADRPGAEALVRELEWVSEGKAPVFSTVASEGQGIEPLVSRWREQVKSAPKTRRRSALQLRHEAMALAQKMLNDQLMKLTSQVKDQEDLISFLSAVAKFLEIKPRD